MSAMTLPLAVAGAAGAVGATAPALAAGADPAADARAADAAVPAPAVTTADMQATAAGAAPATAAEAFAARAQGGPPAIVTAQAGVPATPPPAPSAAGHLGGAVFALVLVVGLILALSWLARRVPGLGGGGGVHPALRIVGSLALGPRDRLVVVAVGETQLLLGVGAGGTRTLHTLDQPLPATVAKSAPAFAQLLAQHFGKKP